MSPGSGTFCVSDRDSNVSYFSTEAVDVRRWDLDVDDASRPDSVASDFESDVVEGLDFEDDHFETPDIEPEDFELFDDVSSVCLLSVLDDEALDLPDFDSEVIRLLVLESDVFGVTNGESLFEMLEPESVGFGTISFDAAAFVALVFDSDVFEALVFEPAVFETPPFESKFFSGSGPESDAIVALFDDSKVVFARGLDPESDVRVDILDLNGVIWLRISDTSDVGKCRGEAESELERRRVRSNRKLIRSNVLYRLSNHHWRNSTATQIIQLLTKQWLSRYIYIDNLRCIGVQVSINPWF